MPKQATVLTPEEEAEFNEAVLGTAALTPEEEAEFGSVVSGKPAKEPLPESQKPFKEPQIVKSALSGAAETASTVASLPASGLSYLMKKMGKSQEDIDRAIDKAYEMGLPLFRKEKILSALTGGGKLKLHKPEPGGEQIASRIGGGAVSGLGFAAPFGAALGAGGGVVEEITGSREAGDIAELVGGVGAVAGPRAIQAAKTIPSRGMQFLREKLGKLATAPESIEAVKSGQPITLGERTGSDIILALEKQARQYPLSSEAMRAADERALQEISKKAKEIVSAKGAVPPVEELGGRIQKGISETLEKEEAAKTLMLEKQRERALQKLGPSREKRTEGINILGQIERRAKEAKLKVREAYKAEQLGINPNEKIAVPELEMSMVDFLKSEDVLRKSPGFEKLKAIVATRAPIIEENPVLELLRNMEARGPVSPASRQSLLAQGERFAPEIKRQWAPTWADLQIFRRDLGQIIRDERLIAAPTVTRGKISSDITPVGAAAAKMKKEVEATMRRYAETQGPGVYEKFEEANRAHANFKKVFASGNINAIRRQLDANPEKLLDNIVTPREYSDFISLERAIGSDGVQPIRGELVKRIIGTEPVFSPKAMMKRISQYGDETLNAVLGNETTVALKRLALDPRGIEGMEIGSPLFRSLAQASPAAVSSKLIKIKGGIDAAAIDAQNVENIQSVAQVMTKGFTEDLGRDVIVRLFGAATEAGTFRPDEFIKNWNMLGERTKGVLFSKERREVLDRFYNISKTSRGSSFAAKSLAAEAAEKPSLYGQGSIINPYALIFGLRTAGRFAGYIGMKLTPKFIAKLVVDDPKLAKQAMETSVNAKDAEKVARRVLAVLGLQAEDLYQEQDQSVP